MKQLPRQVLYGFFTWLIPFAIGFLIWPLHTSMLPLFKSIMIIFGALTGVFFIVLYYKTISQDYLKTGIVLGMIWFLLNIILDLIVLVGAFKTPIFDYFIETGLRYLMIPIMTIGFGYILEIKLCGKPKG